MHLKLLCPDRDIPRDHQGVESDAITRGVYCKLQPGLEDLTMQWFRTESADPVSARPFIREGAELGAFLTGQCLIG